MSVFFSFWCHNNFNLQSLSYVVHLCSCWFCPIVHILKMLSCLCFFRTLCKPYFAFMACGGFLAEHIALKQLTYLNLSWPVHKCKLASAIKTIAKAYWVKLPKNRAVFHSLYLGRCRVLVIYSILCGITLVGWIFALFLVKYLCTKEIPCCFAFEMSFVDMNWPFNCTFLIFKAQLTMQHLVTLCCHQLLS